VKKQIEAGFEVVQAVLIFFLILRPSALKSASEAQQN